MTWEHVNCKRVGFLEETLICTRKAFQSLSQGHASFLLYQVHEIIDETKDCL